jgi:hypothetical protein
MNLIELAEESGFRTLEFNGSKHTDITSITPVFTVELTRFATAIAKQAVEEFKAGLVPVYLVDDDGFGYVDSSEDYYNRIGDSAEKLILYALGETK